MIWTTMIRYWKAALVPLLIFGAFLLRLSGARSASRKIESKANKKKVEFAKKVMKKDKEIELEHDVRVEELHDEIKKKKTSSELSDPNEW